MTRDDIVYMAREAGFLVPAKAWVMKFERFAELVAEAEREACAKIADENILVWLGDLIREREKGN